MAGMAGMGGDAPEKLSGDLWEQPRAAVNLKLIGEEAPQFLAVPWKYVIEDDTRRSFAALLKCPFSKDQTKIFFDTVRDGTNWVQPEGPNGPIPRKTAWMVVAGCKCAYRYGQIEVPPQEYPEWMLQLMTMVMPLCGYTDANMLPNCCNLNWYVDGGMSVGWHTDDEKLFNGKFQDIRIISLSLGASRKFEMRLNWPDESKHERKFTTVVLGDGDVATMEGMFQKHFQHRVPREEGVSEARINLTWRWNIKHQPSCPVCRMRLRG
jgi:alkylated DNA repair dioxygenase AlkB